MKRLAIILVIFLVWISCNEKDPVDPEPTKVEQSYGIFYIGTPNDQSKALVSVIIENDIVKNVEATFVFSDEGVLTSLILDNNTSFGTDELIINISYQDGKIVGAGDNGVGARAFQFDDNLNLLLFSITEQGHEFGEIYEYDDQNRVIRHEWIDKENQLYDYATFTYKDNGNVLKILYRTDSNPTYIEYNADGNIIWFSDVISVYDYRRLIWMNSNGDTIRTEKRNLSDSSLYWFSTKEFLDDNQVKYSEFYVQVGQAINTDFPELYRVSGDTILIAYTISDAEGKPIESLDTYYFGDESFDITYQTFLHNIRQYDISGKEIEYRLYTGDYRKNSLIKKYDDYTYSEVHENLLEKIEYDAQGNAVYRYTYDYEQDDTSQEYVFVRENCIDIESGQLLWYFTPDGNKYNPDGTPYQ